MNKKLLGVIGNKVSKYSDSPKIFKHLLQNNKLDFFYEAIDLNKKEVKKFFSKSKNIYGLNVTSPLKKEVIKYLYKISDLATQVDSVNLIKSEEDRLVGYNTDVFGFSIAVKEFLLEKQVDISMVFGSGGGARSVIYSLFEYFKCKKIFIVSRSKNKINKSLFFNKYKNKLEIIDYDNYQKYLTPVDLLVNTVPDVADISFCLENVKKSAIAFDLNYNTKNDFFLREAKSFCKKFQNGKEMLFFQALKSFEILFGFFPRLK